ncbi:MAG: ferrochelatase [Cyclobacteriaceae bacterium]
MSKQAVLLVNLGTPDSTSVSDVRRYLREFLMDKRVIDIPTIPRWLLVNLIIATFRAPKSAAEYRKLFDDRGSPLKYYTEDLTELVQAALGEDYSVFFAMRYQQPSLGEQLEKIQSKGFTKLHVIPLFPQYASATTGSVVERVMEIVKDWQVIPEIKFTNQFFDHQDFIGTIVNLGKQYLAKTQYDHVVFSFHGLPERQILKADVRCQLSSCCDKLTDQNSMCYRAQCFATARLVAIELGIKERDFTVCFQSRLGRAEWIKPYAEDTLKQLAETGKKKVLVFSPAFVSDCLETTIEVGEAYKEEFIALGGEQWDLVPSLNTEVQWVNCLVNIVKQRV